LLGLSPILKSLTMSTSSDSIWAISTWLLCMNVAFFDYSTGTGAQYVLLEHLYSQNLLIYVIVCPHQSRPTPHLWPPQCSHLDFRPPPTSSR
jgi:hypothetical protein